MRNCVKGSQVRKVEDPCSKPFSHSYKMSLHITSLIPFLFPAQLNLSHLGSKFESN